jgi:hypothetical protein
VLVVIGCDVHGRKHFLAIDDSFRSGTMLTPDIAPREQADLSKGQL